MEVVYVTAFGYVRGKITDKWRRRAEIYKMFADDIPNMDFSEEAAQAYFDFETTGKGNLKIGLFGRQDSYNGYMVGKHWMDVTIKMWKEDDRRGWFLPDELSSIYPKWWLKTIWPNWGD